MDTDTDTSSTPTKKSAAPSAPKRPSPPPPLPSQPIRGSAMTSPPEAVSVDKAYLISRRGLPDSMLASSGNTALQIVADGRFLAVHRRSAQGAITTWLVPMSNVEGMLIK